MNTVWRSPTEAAAKTAVRMLRDRDIPATMVHAPEEGYWLVQVPGAYRALAREIVTGALSRRTGPSANSRVRREYDLPIPGFLAVAGGALAVFLVWYGVGAPGGRTVAVLVGTTVVAFAGLWFVAPDFYEVESMRFLAVRFLAGGVLIALGYRLVFDVVPIRSAPYRTYPPWEWLLSALVLSTVIGAAGALIVRSTEIRRVRQTMIVFGVVGLAVGITAGATYLLDLGYTTERWGLVSVWATIGIYPILSIPAQTLLAGILGWGWAVGTRTNDRGPIATALLFSTLGLALFDHAVVRSPFWGPLIIIVLVVIWMRLFARNPENDPMVQRIPRTLIDEYGVERDAGTH